MPQEITIIDTRKVPSALPERIGKMDVFVTYQTPDMRTYIVNIAEEEFDESHLTERIRQDLQERSQWTGKKISI